MRAEGIVIKSTGSWYTVKTDANDKYRCKIRGKLRTWGFETTNPIAVGDRVEIETIDEETGLIIDIKERRNCIVRRAAKLSKRKHLLACNVDHAVLIVTVDFPKTHTEFIDRFLVSAEAYKIPEKTLIINKMDLYNSEQMQVVNEWTNIYRNIGYRVLHISAVEGTNLEQVKDILKNKINVLVGNSGVGKSTLINAIDPSLNIKTSEISRKYKTGKHTTTFPQMYELYFGGYIIDTPGIRAFGTADLDKADIAHNFPEMFALLPYCKYKNCLHINEPGCAVKEALAEGKIAISRYKSYLSMVLDENTKYRIDEYKA